MQSGLLITSSPINDSDIPILKALIYETSMTDDRYTTVRKLVGYFSRAVALVTAHEVGHSLGLDHNGVGGTLMASGWQLFWSVFAVAAIMFALVFVFLFDDKVDDKIDEGETAGATV